MATATPPALTDFPEAEVIGGAVVLDGKNMGDLLAGNMVAPSALGQAYLDAKSAEAPASLAAAAPVEPPANPVAGVLDPTKMAPVTPEAKKVIRRRKQNEAVVEAMNAPTAEELTAMEAEEAPAPAPAEPPAAG